MQEKGEKERDSSYTRLGDRVRGRRGEEWGRKEKGPGKERAPERQSLTDGGRETEKGREA